MKISRGDETYKITKGDGVGPTGPSGAAGGVIPVEFDNTDLVADGDKFKYTTTHSKGVAYIPFHQVQNASGAKVSVPAVYIDTNSFKLVFPAAISGTPWKIIYF